MKKGKILKIKFGYNPNSSSVGTLLIAFPVTLFVLSIIFNVVSAIIISKKDDKNEKK